MTAAILQLVCDAHHQTRPQLLLNTQVKRQLAWLVADRFVQEHQQLLLKLVLKIVNTSQHS